MAKSKFFRVATEGATTDGRQIDRKWITQMAQSYDRAKYAARVNIEHIRGYGPGSDFGSYGDVLALEARTVEDGKLALFAQIEPLPQLIELNKRKQKIFSSIEVNPDFAGTGQAYLMGLAVTDSPASLGTEELKFAAQAQTNWLNTRKQAPGNLFSAATAIELEMLEEAPPDAETEKAMGLFASIISRLTQNGGEGKTAPAETAPTASVGKAQSKAENEYSAEYSAQMLQAITQLGNASKAQAEALAAMKTEFTQLSEKVKQLEQTPPGNYAWRAPATGYDTSADNQTDC